MGEGDPSIPLTINKTLLEWEGCDAVINLGILGRRIHFKRLADAVQAADQAYTRHDLEASVNGFYEDEERYIRQIVQLMEAHGKPIVGVSFLTDEASAMVYRTEDCDVKGVFYETPERAVKSLARMIDYSRYRKQTNAA